MSTCNVRRTGNSAGYLPVAWVRFCDNEGLFTIRFMHVPGLVNRPNRTRTALDALQSHTSFVTFMCGNCNAI